MNTTNKTTSTFMASDEIRITAKLHKKMSASMIDDDFLAKLALKQGVKRFVR